MVQRLSKKPISEGFELWDRGYLLGAMRLFMFKAETSPPFHLGPCLDAVAHMLARLEEKQDAKENFGYAAEKYDLIQQPIMAQIMTVKGMEVECGPQVALAEMTKCLQTIDPKREAKNVTDVRTRSGLGRAYHYHAELLWAVNPELNASQALADAQLAVELGWDRVHLAHWLLGTILAANGDTAAATAAFEKCISTNGNFIAAYEALIPIYHSSDPQRALALLDKAITLHPRSSFIRDKAFLLSTRGNDVEALRFLDEHIANPPHEETEALGVGGSTTCTLLKAKAIILADQGKLPEALSVAEEALRNTPGDEEAERLVSDIKAA